MTISAAAKNDSEVEIHSELGYARIKVEDIPALVMKLLELYFDAAVKGAVETKN